MARAEPLTGARLGGGENIYAIKTAIRRGSLTYMTLRLRFYTYF